MGTSVNNDSINTNSLGDNRSSSNKDTMMFVQNCLKSDSPFFRITAFHADGMWGSIHLLIIIVIIII